MSRAGHAATVTVALVTILLTACGKDNPTGPKPSEITGRWTATKVEYVNKAAPATRLSLTGADMEYDFDGNSVPEQADQNMTLVR